MGATDKTAALRLWAFGTFRTATFVVAFALYLHLTDRLLGSLSSLNTEVGLAAFVMLWASTLIATRTGWRHMADGDVSASSIVAATTVAGGWNGLFVWVPILFVLVMNTMAGSIAGALMVGLLGSVMGGVLAFTIGAIFGFAYGIVDAVLLRIVRVCVLSQGIV
jgi:hypothetical protein